MNYVYQLLIGLISGVFGAWIAMFFGLRRFYSEKWWEKRAATFIELTDGIYQLKVLQEYYSELKLYRREGPEEYPEFVELNDEQLREMRLEAARARSLIKKFSHVGQLLITDGASQLLRDYLNEEKRVDYDVHHRGWDTEEAEEHLLSITKRLFENMLEISRKELKAGK
jgi:hypothetical protein